MSGRLITSEGNNISLTSSLTSLPAALTSYHGQKQRQHQKREHPDNESNAPFITELFHPAPSPLLLHDTFMPATRSPSETSSSAASPGIAGSVLFISQSSAELLPNQINGTTEVRGTSKE